jgi:arginase
VPEYVCIGVPHFLGKLIDGRDEVAAIQASGIAAEIGATWVDVRPEVALDEDPIVAVNRALAEAIQAYPGRVPIVFAADCVSALGAMKGLEAQRPHIFWYDAHGDFNTPETTPSGFLGGMPLAMLVGRGDLGLLDALDLKPIPEENVVLTDARDLDLQEAEALARSRVTHLRRFEDSLAFLLTGRPLYVHLDTDVVDAAELPGLLYPTPGGPSLEAVAASVERVAHDGHVVGLLVSLWSGALVDDNAIPLAATLSLVRAFLAGMQG